MAVTWHDILKFDGVGADEIVDDVKVSCPEFTGADIYGGSFNIAKGQTVVDKDVFTGVSRIDSNPPSIFKQMNQGVGISKGEYETKLFELAPAGTAIRVDRDLVRINPERGAAYMKNEAKRAMEDVIRKLGVQFFYGHGVDATVAGAEADGFQGLQGIVDSSLVTSAGGTVAGASTLTSAYLVRFDSFSGVTWLFGNQGSLEVSDIETVPVYSTVSGVDKVLHYLQQTITLYPGLAIQSKYSAGRIANISTSTAGTAGSISTSAFTDEHIMLALEKMKEKPDVIFMTRKAGVLLGASRTNTVSFKGASLKVAPISMPVDAYDIPILYTDSLVNSESAWS